MSADGIPIDTTVAIVTPENIAFHYQVAGPFRRLPAFLIDVGIQVLALVGVALLAMVLSVGIGSASLAVWILVQFLLNWFYGGVFETYWNGQTPGKRILGIRVLSANGRPVSGSQAVMRNILRSVDMGPLISAEVLGGPPVPLWPTFAIGLAVMAFNRRFQRLGDVVSRTIVVVEDRPWLTGIARIEDPRAVQLASYLPTDLRVSRSMARALSHYAERRRYFSLARRREVARHLAQPLLTQFQLPDNTSYDLLLCAMYHRLFIADQGAEDVDMPQAGTGLIAAQPTAESLHAGEPTRDQQPTSPTGDP